MEAGILPNCTPSEGLSIWKLPPQGGGAGGGGGGGGSFKKSEKKNSVIGKKKFDASVSSPRHHRQPSIGALGHRCFSTPSALA